MRIFSLSLLLIILSIISLAIGVGTIDWLALLKGHSEEWMLLTTSRIPRTVALIIAGVGMSISGIIMQQITQNKFVAPTTAGTLDAAKMGLLVAMVFVPGLDFIGKLLFAFLFTFILSMVYLKIIERIQFKSVIYVPIVGLMYGAILASITTFVAVNLNIVQDVNAWLIGDFSGVLSGNYELIYLSLPAVIIAYLYSSRFSVVGMGRDFSKNLGLNYLQIMRLGIFCAALSVSTIVITVGIIPFLGLIIPNLVSLMMGDNLKKTLPIIALMGAVFLLVCDIIGRLVIYPFEVPIGLTAGIVGALLFLILLLRRR